MARDFRKTKMKDKTLSFSRHEKFIISYSSVAYIEESDSLELKVLRKTEELHFKVYLKIYGNF